MVTNHLDYSIVLNFRSDESYSFVVLISEDFGINNNSLKKYDMNYKLRRGLGMFNL